MPFLLQDSLAAFIHPGELRLIVPQLVLSICGFGTLVIEVVLPSRKSRASAYFSLLGVSLSLLSLLVLWRTTNRYPFPLDGLNGMVRIDDFALLFEAVFLCAAGLTIAIAIRYLDYEREQHGEFYSLVLFATAGMMFVACGYDLLELYISIELVALSFYILVGFSKRDRLSNEAGLKYFLLGAFSSGILLYGISLLFGVTGSTNLTSISRRLSELAVTAPGVRPLLLLSMITLASGLFFKVAAAPFHMWAPDAYQGAPTPVTAFLSTGSKAAGFALYTRIFWQGLPSMRVDWAPLLGIVAALTIMVGNWAAITQNNSKRLLAYSSISNSGYLLLGLLAANVYGFTGLVTYFVVYTLMNIGAFGVIISLRRRGKIGDAVDDFAGLAHKAPWTALMMSVFLLSLGGLPATGGFIGKYFLFGGLLERGAADGKSWYYWLAGWAILNTVISFYYYVRFIKLMYLSDEADEQPLSLTPALKTSLVLTVAGVMIIGIFPQPLLHWVQILAESLSAGPSGTLAR